MVESSSCRIARTNRAFKEASLGCEWCLKFVGRQDGPRSLRRLVNRRNHGGGLVTGRRTRAICQPAQSTEMGIQRLHPAFRDAAVSLDLLLDLRLRGRRVLRRGPGGHRGDRHAADLSVPVLPMVGAHPHILELQLGKWRPPFNLPSTGTWLSVAPICPVTWQPFERPVVC